MNLIKFTDDASLMKPDGSTDFTFLSKDCFHFSQKGHSEWFHVRLNVLSPPKFTFLVFAAINLWNQMLTPESERSSHSSVGEMNVKCPTNEFPYLRTRGN